MILLLFCAVVSATYFLIERIRSMWPRWILHVVLFFIGTSAAFKIGFGAGDSLERGDAARTVQEVMEMVQETSKTNTAAELRLKLEIIRRDIPKVILEDDRSVLLTDLKMDH